MGRRKKEKITIVNESKSNTGSHVIIYSERLPDGSTRSGITKAPGEFYYSARAALKMHKAPCIKQGAGV